MTLPAYMKRKSGVGDYSDLITLDMKALDANAPVYTISNNQKTITHMQKNANQYQLRVAKLFRWEKLPKSTPFSIGIF